WVDYRLPSDFGLISEQAQASDRQPITFPPIILRFAVDAENGVLPPITKAVAVAETMRRTAIKRDSNASGKPASKLLAGKKGDGAERREGHDHPFFLPLDLEGRGVIDAVDVWLPKGCTHEEFRALTGISKIWENVILDGEFALTYLGQVEPMRSSRWYTVTPLVLDRFPKRRGPGGSVVIDGPEEQISRALEQRGFGKAL